MIKSIYCSFLNKYNPDICILGETKLNPSHKITFNHYTLVRNDRIIKRRINFNKIKNKNLKKFFILSM